MTRKTVCNAIEIGRGQPLVEIKEALGHGNFRKWLNSEFAAGSSTAAKLMKVYQAFEGLDISDMNIALTALYRLASPKTPKLAIDEALDRAGNGECITPSVANEIIHKHTDQSIDVDAVEVSEPSSTIISEQDSYGDKALNLFDLELEDSPLSSDRQLVRLSCSIQYSAHEG